MYLDDVKYKSKTKTWMRVIVIALILGFVLTFHTELGLLFRLIWGVIQLFFGKPLIVHEKALSALIVLAFNTIIFVIAFFAMAYFVASQALVPVSTPLEKRRTTWHLILHMLRVHGPAIFVQGGKIIESEEDKVRSGPGLIAIDYNSAVVLEEQLPSPSLTLSDMVPPSVGKERDKQPVIQKNLSLAELSPLTRFFYEMGIYQPYHSPRAVGAGITFTRARERIRGVVDLRKQSRTLISVNGYTRDGIKVTTNVWTLFTIGQIPEVLDVTYDGERIAKNLKVIRFKDQNRGNSNSQVEIETFLDELDEIDRQEIHVHADELLRSQAMSAYTPPPQENLVPQFNAERVFAAVFSEARADEEKAVPWMDLPPIVAVDIFRELLLQYNYDQLFQPDQPADYPVFKLRQLFRTKVRNTAALSYRLVFHKSRRPLTTTRYDLNDLRVSEIFDLKKPKILRERGIKLIACGFTDLIPPDEVYIQRLDNWRAKWDKEKRITQATYELETSRIRNKARQQAQQELRYEFFKILQASEYPKEVLALRVLQALENAAADPKTNQLLPQETLELMRTLNMLINR